MNGEFQKLLVISYDKKKFMILLDNNNRKTFLEIKDNKYKYPLLDDFIYLNSIYNNYNPYMCYLIPKFSYKEKVIIARSLLVLDVIAVGIIGGKLKSDLANYEVKLTDNGIVLNAINPIYANKEYTIVNIKNSEDLTEVLGYDSISTENVHEVIDSNTNLNEQFKTCAHTLVQKLEKMYSSFDFRIFYENMKTLNIVSISNEELKAKYGHIAACYDSVTNTIYYQEEMDENAIIHELAHTSYHYYRIDGKNLYLRSVNNGSFIDEALNSEITNLCSQEYAYINEKLVSDYLMEMGNFNILDYNQKGVWALIEGLEDKYPSVDINYIIEVLDAYKNSLVKEGITRSLDSSPYLLDELFKMSIYNIDKDYNSFKEFAKLFRQVEDKTILYQYLNKYNKILEDKGYRPYITLEKINNDLKAYQNVDALYTCRDGVFPCLAKNYNYILDRKGNLRLIKGNGGKIFRANNINSLLPIAYISNYDKFGTDDFWNEFAFQYINLPEYYYQKVPIYSKGKFIKAEYIPDLDLTITLNSNKEMGYVISKQEEIIYQEGKDIVFQTPKISLTLYLNNIKINDSLNLDKILNLEYLKSYIGKYNDILNNLTILDDQVVFIPSYKVNITSDNSIVPLPYELRKIKVVKDINNNYVISSLYNDIKIPLEYYYLIDNLDEEDLYFEEVLKYYNILDINKDSYNFSEKEILELFINYFNDLIRERSR